MKSIGLIFIFLLLLAAEILRVYFIMPFPGSQENETIDIAYWLHQNIKWIRIIGLVILVVMGWQLFRKTAKGPKVLFASFFLIYAIAFYFFNFRFQADKMFYQPANKLMAAPGSNKIPLNKLVIGIELNGMAAAYPIQLIGYHHQVRDTVGNVPVMVTYCTVCRTGRVFRPQVNKTPENFRLVGMDHFNAMFEDHTTGSWWRQASGEAIAGPLKGNKLEEIPSRQMTLAAWLDLFPSSAILQMDSIYKKDYDDLELFDNGTIESGLEKRDSASWKLKSWVIGIEHNKVAKAYDWNRLIHEKIISDSLPGLPLLLTLSADSLTAYSFNRKLNKDVLDFKLQNGKILDTQTGSVWNEQGMCLEGIFKGNRLNTIQTYQEFWHSWQTFHPSTKKY